MTEEEKANLQSFKDAILQMIEAYEFTFGDICGTFEDIKYELLAEFYSQEDEDS